MALEYVQLGNAWTAHADRDPASPIVVEVGDLAHPDRVLPRVALRRWDDVSLAARLRTDRGAGAGASVAPTVDVADGRIRYRAGVVEAHFYDLPASVELPHGGYECEIVLNQRPAANVVQFDIAAEGLEFLYQPALTDAEKDALGIADAGGTLHWYGPDGAEITREVAALLAQPEHVIGSYAAYRADGARGDFSALGGLNYRAGKAFHIYRPRIVDANGAGVWGALAIDGKAGTLAVTIPQAFLDAAVYPIHHTAGLTIGYTTVPVGGSSSIGSTLWGCTAPGADGSLTSITAYLAVKTNNLVQAGLWRLSDLALLANTSGNDHTGSSSASWQTFDLTSPYGVASGMNYLLGICDDGTVTPHSIYWDNGAPANYAKGQSSVSPGSLPNPMSPTAQQARYYGIYGTYTPAAGAKAPWHLFFNAGR